MTATPSVLPEELRIAYGGDLWFPPSGSQRHYVIGNFVSTIDGVVSYKVSRPGESHPEAESPRGVSPRGAHRTVLEPLDSHGSCHPVKAAAFHRHHRVPPVSR
jgi:hypothetical protein